MEAIKFYRWWDANGGKKQLSDATYLGEHDGDLDSARNAVAAAVKRTNHQGHMLVAEAPKGKLASYGLEDYEKPSA